MSWRDDIRSFLRGMGSILDLWPSHPTDYRTGAQRDVDALAGDWQQVGDDMRETMRQFEEEMDG